MLNVLPQSATRYAVFTNGGRIMAALDLCTALSAITISKGTIILGPISNLESGENSRQISITPFGAALLVTTFREAARTNANLVTQ